MNNAYLGTVWYETEFECEINNDEYALLTFDGICPYATVYLNSKKRRTNHWSAQIFAIICP